MADSLWQIILLCSKKFQKGCFFGLGIIIITVFFLMQYLTNKDGHAFSYFRRPKKNVTERYSIPSTFWKQHVTDNPKIRTSTYVASWETEKGHLQYQNVIKTALKTPMASISRNILDIYSEYRQIQSAVDFKELYDAQFCVVELKVDSKTKTVTAGTELRVRIHLYNGYNQSLTQGGDLLNIWLRNTNGSSSVAGYVVDHMNGTYTGHVMAFWAGNVTVKVSVTNTKDAIGLYTNYVNIHGSYKFINATFSENKKSEMTQCAPTMSDWLNKTYGGFCNLTHENYNISLFCGKPKSVSCKNWVTYGWDDSLYYDDKTRNILMYKDVRLKEIKATVVPGSKGDLVYQTPATPCNMLPRVLTWNSTVPSGFLYKGEYHNLICRPTVNESKESYRTCLKNRPVISIGDSTTRQWFLRLSQSLQIKYSEGFINNNAWQKYAHAYNNKLGLDVEWQPHELPFHGSPGSDRKSVKSVAYRLNKIPGNSTAIVIIHWYAHIARCCDHKALREHVRHAKAAIIRLLKRSPDVQVFVKGPHLITFYNAHKPYAFIGMFVEQVLLEEFKELQHKIVYLDQWDMSVATENVNIHPDPLLDNISLNNLINFACRL